MGNYKDASGRDNAVPGETSGRQSSWRIIVGSLSRSMVRFLASCNGKKGTRTIRLAVTKQFSTAGSRDEWTWNWTLTRALSRAVTDDDLFALLRSSLKNSILDGSFMGTTEDCERYAKTLRWRRVRKVFAMSFRRRIWQPMESSSMCRSRMRVPHVGWELLGNFTDRSKLHSYRIVFV